MHPDAYAMHPNADAMHPDAYAMHPNADAIHPDAYAMHPNIDSQHKKSKAYSSLAFVLLYITIFFYLFQKFFLVHRRNQHHLMISIFCIVNLNSV